LVVTVKNLRKAVHVLINSPHNGLFFAQIPNRDTVDAWIRIGGIPRLDTNVSGDIIINGAATGVVVTLVIRELPSVRSLFRGDRGIHGEGNATEGDERKGNGNAETIRNHDASDESNERTS